jgi:hypothetical protein
MELEKLVRLYCDRTGQNVPIYLDDKIKLLTRMVQCGMITQKEADVYVEEHKRNDERGTLFPTH